ncbi:GNAT family N-acetyltransferase [Pedobacter sp. P351]|uniref:GNAT family N-acetyltransferase n=1 Tax=Pedobacter superstes TaxID=3133441 RepID=UPI00309E04AA
MIEIIRTTSDDKRFKNLILELDNDLMSRYTHADYKFDANIQLNALDTAVVAQITNITVGCGCFKEINSTTIEIKRMYVNPYFRGFGVASMMIDALTKWAQELFYDHAVLETGIKQPESIKLYEKHGFIKIPSFPPYNDLPNSVCMGKEL